MEKIEEVVKKINKLDLRFELTDYYEIEHCSERCLQDTSAWQLTELEKRCYSENFHFDFFKITASGG